MPAMARMLPWITKLAAFLPPGVGAFLFPVCSFVVALMYGYSFPVISILSKSRVGMMQTQVLPWFSTISLCSRS